MTSELLGSIRDAVKHMASVDRRRSDDRGYVAYYTDTVAADGGTINLHVKNDSADTIIDVSAFPVSSQFRGSYNIYDVFSSAPTGGTDAEIDNLRMDAENGSRDTGEMTVNHSVSFTASGTHWSDVLPSGGAGSNTTGGADNGTEPLIEPGREVVVELTNDSANARPGAVGVVYTEVPDGQA